MSSKKELYFISISFLAGVLAGYLLATFFPLNLLIDLDTPGTQIDAGKGIQEAGNASVREPESIEAPCDIQIEVSGAVNYPGVYCLGNSSIVNDALKVAGGQNKLSAERYISQKINLAAKMKDNEKIYFPFEDDIKCEEVSFSLDNSLDRYLGGDSGTKEEGCLDLNFSTLKQLDGLPGVGETTATKIIEGRPYKSVEDLKINKIVSEKVFVQIEKLLCL